MRGNTVHVTLADVARKAHVGASTVSRVINGARRVSPQTLARVRAAIQQLNYHPNQVARTLRGEQTRTIGLIVPSVADSFFANCAEAAEEVCQTHNFHLTVACSNNSPRIELEHLHSLIQRRVDGLLLAPADSHNPELVRFLDRVLIPVVSIDRPVHDSSVPCVISNNYRGAKDATQHLIAHGCKKIVLLGLQPSASGYTNRERIRGYRRAMQDAGLTPLVDVSMRDYESAELILKMHLDGPNPPDAIFAIRNLVTIYSVRTLRKLNIKVPERVALLGFDDFELADTLEPPITVVRQQAALMGKTAVEALFERVAPRRRHNPVSIGRIHDIGAMRLDTDLILRGSCGCAEWKTRKA
jgi:LacI family transcriptional regulator